jgi:hypothetical protein
VIVLAARSSLGVDLDVNSHASTVRASRVGDKQRVFEVIEFVGGEGLGELGPGIERLAERCDRHVEHIGFEGRAASAGRRPRYPADVAWRGRRASTNP